MMGKWIDVSRGNCMACLMVLSMTALHVAEASFPQIIEFSQLQFQEDYYSKARDEWPWQLGESAYKMGLTAFNDGPEIGVFLSFLKEQHQVGTVIETGTYRGASAQFFSRYFDEVHTIDINQEHYSNAKQIFAERNVNCYLGSSEIVLAQILPGLQSKRVLFYLDAHWHDHWPLLEELHEISKTHYDNCIVVVDDFKVPDRPDILFDHYHGKECSYEYIKEGLSQIFSDYSYYYILPKNTASRAKFVAIPKAWEKN